MISRRVAKRYINGLLQVAQQQNKVEEVEKALAAIDGMIRDRADLRDVLFHPTIPRQHKKSLLHKLMGDCPDLFKRFVDFVVDKKRERIFECAYEEYRDSADHLRGVVRGRIKSATALTGDQEQLLATELGRTLGKKVVLDYEVDAGMLAGMQVFIGSYIVDGSLTSRLNRLHKHLLDEVSQIKSDA